MLGCVCDVEVTGSLLAGLGSVQRVFCVLCGSGSARCESSGLKSLWLCSSLCYIPELKIPAGTGAAPAMFVQVPLLRPLRLSGCVKRRGNGTASPRSLRDTWNGGDPTSLPSSGIKAFGFGSLLRRTSSSRSVWAVRFAGTSCRGPNRISPCRTSRFCSATPGVSSLQPAARAARAAGSRGKMKVRG